MRDTRLTTRGSQECGCVTLCVHSVRSRGYSRIRYHQYRGRPGQGGGNSDGTNQGIHGVWVPGERSVEQNCKDRKMIRSKDDVQSTHICQGKDHTTAHLRQLLYLVLDDAFEKLHTQVEGTVFALRKPQILPPRETMSALGDRRCQEEARSLGVVRILSEITKSSHAMLSHRPPILACVRRRTSRASAVGNGSTRTSARFATSTPGRN